MHTWKKQTHFLALCAFQKQTLLVYYWLSKLCICLLHKRLLSNIQLLSKRPASKLCVDCFFWYSQTPEGNILGLCSCEMFYLIYVLLFVVRFNICWAFWIKIATTMQLEMMLMLKWILKLKESAKNLCQNADLIDCSSFKKKSLLVPDRALITKDYKKWQKYKNV